MIVRQIPKDLFDKIRAAEADRDKVNEEWQQAIQPYTAAVVTAQGNALKAAGLQSNKISMFGTTFTRDELTGACFVVTKEHWE